MTILNYQFFIIHYTSLLYLWYKMFLCNIGIVKKRIKESKFTQTQLFKISYIFILKKIYIEKWTFWLVQFLHDYFSSFSFILQLFRKKKTFLYGIYIYKFLIKAKTCKNMARITIEKNTLHIDYKFYRYIAN